VVTLVPAVIAKETTPLGQDREASLLSLFSMTACSVPWIADEQGVGAPSDTMVNEMVGDVDV
jgi:hypothetical protein